MNKLENFYYEVASVAHELYEKRGRVHGHDMEDWLKAEMIVKKRYENEMGLEAKNSDPPDRTKAAKKTK